MTSGRFAFLVISLALALTTAAGAQRHHDPFTSAEIDQIRDASWEPQQRLPLYLKFSIGRVVRLGEVARAAKTKGRTQQTHDKLDDFLLIYDELNDNIDTYIDRRNDIRKPLKLVIDADTEFQAKLLGLKDAAGVPPEEAKQYEFILSNALDTVNTSAEDHRKLLDEQEEASKHKKKFEKATSGKPE